MFEFSVAGVGVRAPGLRSWCHSVQVFTEAESYCSAPLVLEAPDLLAANERRRISSMTKMVLLVAGEAMHDAGTPAFDSAVFASSNSDLDIAQKICSAAWMDGHPVSPTDFHNSVHNAASAYWSLATGSQAASSSVSAGDASFAAGMLDACVALQDGFQNVLVVFFEWPPLPPLLSKTNMTAPGAVALVLTADNPGWCLRISDEGSGESTCQNAELEVLRNANPAMRSLPWLESLCTDAHSVILPYVNGQTLQVDALS